MYLELWDFCLYSNSADENPDTRQQFIALAKKEAEQEEKLYGDFFGPDGTTFTFDYKPQLPFSILPAYIAVQKK